jgi:WD40 repeat protein
MSLRISLVQQLEQQQAPTWDLHFSPDGQRLVSSDGTALHVWRQNAHSRWEYERSLPFRHAVFPRFAPDGGMLAFRDQENLLQLISLDGKNRATFPCPASSKYAFSPDQRWVVSGDTMRNMLLWDLRTSQWSTIPLPIPVPIHNTQWYDPLQKGIDFSNETATHFQFTPDGQRLVFGVSSDEGYVHICHVDPVHKRLTRQGTFPTVHFEALSISPQGNMLAFAHRDSLSVYHLDSLHLLQVFPRTTDEDYSLLAFSPDSRSLISSKSDGWVDLFSLDPFRSVQSFAAHPGLSSHATDPIGGLDWSSTGLIATGGTSVFEDEMWMEDYSIRIWKREDEEQLTSLLAPA